MRLTSAFILFLKTHTNQRYEFTESYTHVEIGMCVTTAHAHVNFIDLKC